MALVDVCVTVVVDTVVLVTVVVVRVVVVVACWQLSPIQPELQAQEYALTLSEHVSLFWHGFGAQSSMLVHLVLLFPPLVHPLPQMHEYLLFPLTQVLLAPPHEMPEHSFTSTHGVLTSPPLDPAAQLHA